MAFELGPGWQRKPPKGWVAVTLVARDHGTWIPQDVGAERGETVIDTVCKMRATWEVQPEKGESYEVIEEDRRAPIWVLGGITGKRWYSVSLKYKHGFMNGVAVPAYANPDKPTELWIDWDGAFRAHEEAWDKKDRVEREIAERSNPVDRVTNRVLHPFSKKLEQGEEQLVDEELGRRQAKQQAQAEHFASRAAEKTREEQAAKGITEDHLAEQGRRVALMQRLKKEGRDEKVLVVSIEESGRQMPTGPVLLYTLQFDDGRTVEYEHIWGLRHAKSFKQGKQIKVKVDPADPDIVELA